MGRSRSLVGMEVPITGSDSVKWIEVTVSSATRPTSSSSSPPFAPLTEDTAACSIIGDPPTYLIWRIHKSQPSALDLVEFCAHREYPRTGIRILFPDALCPFAFICKDEIRCTSGNLYLLYALTVSGVAYLFKLRNIYTYESCSIFPSNDLIEFNLQTHPHYGEITAVAAASGSLVIGRNDGSVSLFRLGMFDQSAPDFVHELRDDAGIGRLWGFMSSIREERRRLCLYSTAERSNFIMEDGDWASSSDGASDSEIYLQDAYDEEHYCTSGSISKLQFRKDVSKVVWNDEMRMAEVVEKKGKMWTTTGIVRNSKTYCSIEETLFLAELGALRLLDDNDVTISLKGLYDKVAQGKCGCCWESFEVYRHLKSLGYIVGRHGVPWTLKGAKTGLDSNQVASESNSMTDEESEEKSSIIELVNNMHIAEVKLVFDVYLPNSKFRKSFPGDPSFVLCLTSGCPPSKAEIEDLERQCSGIPFKFCHVAHGRVSFFSFSRVELPVLP